MSGYFWAGFFGYIAGFVSGGLALILMIHTHIQRTRRVERRDAGPPTWSAGQQIDEQFYGTYARGLADAQRRHNEQAAALKEEQGDLIRISTPDGYERLVGRLHDPTEKAAHEAEEEPKGEVVDALPAVILNEWGNPERAYGAGIKYGRYPTQGTATQLPPEQHDGSL